MALDVAIYSALLAAWHYKWASDRPRVAYRIRPCDADPSLSVLFDREVSTDGSGDGAPRSFPTPSPGTPRHPSYPAGHSALGGAASEILGYFFPHEAVELEKLAGNMGIARLWAAVHYRSDHEQGIKLGQSVARLVISQLESDGVPPLARPPAHSANDTPRAAPTQEQVRVHAYESRRECMKKPIWQPCFRIRTERTR